MPSVVEWMHCGRFINRILYRSRTNKLQLPAKTWMNFTNTELRTSKTQHSTYRMIPFREKQKQAKASISLEVRIANGKLGRVVPRGQFKEGLGDPGDVMFPDLGSDSVNIHKLYTNNLFTF